MLQEIPGVSVAEHDWRTTSRLSELESHVRRLESRIEHLDSITQSRIESRDSAMTSRLESLESIMDARLERQKAEIWTEIWEERLKVLFAISVGVMAFTWIVIIVRALR